MTYEARHATLGAEADTALLLAAERLQLEQEAHADTRAELSGTQTDLERVQQEYAEHMRTHEPVLTPNQNLIGVQVFTDRGHYTNFPRIRDHLAQTGFKRARSFLGLGTDQAEIDHMNALSDEFGIEWMLTVGQPRDVLSDAERSEIVDKRRRIKKVRRLCSWNEPNNAKRGNGPIETWVQTTADHGAWLMDQFGDVDRIGSMQLWAGELPKHHAALDLVAPAVKGTFHDIVWHLYQVGEARIIDFENRYYRHFGKLPVVCSETGMSTALRQVQGAEKRTPDEQAPYLRDHVGLYVKRGHEVYVFEMENGPNEDTNREDGLGLYFNDGSPKPAAGTMRELLTA